MKKILILPIVSLLGATVFCTGAFSMTDGTSDTIFTPMTELFSKITEDNMPDVLEGTGSTIDDTVTDITENTPNEVITQQGGETVTKRPLLSGATDDPLGTGSDQTDESFVPDTTPTPPFSNSTVVTTTTAPITTTTVLTTTTTTATTTTLITTTKPLATTTKPVTTTKPITTTTKPATTTTKPTTTTKAPVTTTSPTLSSQAQKIVAIAKGEIGVAEKKYNNVKYNTWYFGKKVSDKNSSGTSYAWCALFIGWCGNQAGISESTLPIYRSSTQYKEYFEDRGLYHKYSASYIPQPGDLIFIDWQGRRGTIDHIGIVVSCEDGYVTTVEGNYSDKVSCNTYKLNNKMIVGYASPNYK